MFSPLNDPQADEWFRRFDAASRRLPAEERASQRQEIQQHLEGLVAANKASGQPHDEAWQAALKQFGDPTQIGRKMYREWQQGRTGFRADIKAILFGVGLQVLRRFIVVLLFFFWFNSLYAHGKGLVGIPFVVQSVLAYGGSVFIYAAVGRKYPLQAIKGAFYTDLLWNLCYWMLFVIAASNQHNTFVHPLPVWFIHSVLLIPVWMVSHVAIAYLASMTKRGWYRPSLADFTLTLPRRRAQWLSPRG